MTRQYGDPNAPLAAGEQEWNATITFRMQHGMKLADAEEFLGRLLGGYADPVELAVRPVLVRIDSGAGRPAPPDNEHPTEKK